jgi:hypothetical protein
LRDGGRRRFSLQTNILILTTDLVVNHWFPTCGNVVRIFPTPQLNDVTAAASAALFAQSESGSTPWGTLVSADLNSSLVKFRTNGRFTLTLRINSLEAAPLIQAIDLRMDAIYRVSKCLTLGCPYDPEDGDTYLFSFSKPARTIGKDGKVQRRKPGLWDSKSNRLHMAYQIPLGSVVSVSFGFIRQYNPARGAGLSLELHGVQIDHPA